LKRLLTLLLLFPLTVFSQLSDSFTDGDFTNNPAWLGEQANFEVDLNNQLHLNAPAVTDTSYLYTSSVAIDTASWECYVRLEFNPSASNKARIYLVSDQSDLEGALNGYFIQLGNTDDEVSLYRQTGMTITEIIDGADDLLNESNVEVLVKATRDTDGNWELLADTSLNYTFVSQGNVQDTTHQASQYFGVLCQYTSTRSDKFYFDDFIITGNAYLDNESPEVLSAMATSANTLNVTFNEPLDQTSAETLANYSVSNGLGSPSLAVLSSPTSVDMTFSSTFTIGTNLVLTIDQVADVSGNALSNVQTAFIYYEFSTPGYRDIVINEIMADPTPSFGLPEFEFVELFNPTNLYFDLSNLSFSDASSSGMVSSFEVLSPGEYVILCDEEDTASFNALGRTIGLSSLPALNNSGDDISIIIDSLVIDQLSYSDTWYNDSEKANGGYSLELVNPETPCSGKNNWTASFNSNGGTPGQQNSVYDVEPDITAPIATEVSIISLSEIQVVFDEVMDSASLVNGSYTIDNGIIIQSVLPDAFFESVSLTLSANLDSSIIYTLIISGQSDCVGNALISDSFEIGIGSSPAPYDLIINEIYPTLSESSPLPNAEYIEIYNRSAKLISTEGLRISDASSSSSLINGSILPGEYIIVCDDNNASLFTAFGKVIPCSSLPSLNNSGDAISIELGNRIVDQINYSESWYVDAEKSNGGWSLERVNPNDVCGSSSNWRESDAQTGGTPGEENSIFVDGPAPELEIVSALFTSKTSIELNFNGRLDTLSNLSTKINNDQYQVLFYALSDIGIINADNEFEGVKVYSIEIDSLSNCAGILSYDLSFEVYLHDSGDVVINEVLSNPRGSGSDFVELYNISQYDIDLNGWALAYFDSNDSLRFNDISSTSKIIASQDYIALCEDNNDVISNYPFTVAQNLHVMNLPSYSNGEGSVILYDQLGRLMDRFDYSEDLHFALLDDLDGVSLERLSPSRASDDEGNWHSASSTKNYATPGYRNSQDYQNASETAGVVLSSEFISPDNDGYQDVVNINYNFPAAGYSMTIRVFNDRGIKVKTVASNQLIGANGSFTWDGTKDNGEKATTGIHIILAEAFNLKNEKERFRLPVVVASRLN